MSLQQKRKQDSAAPIFLKRARYADVDKVVSKPNPNPGRSDQAAPPPPTTQPDQSHISQIQEYTEPVPVELLSEFRGVLDSFGPG